MFSSVDEAKDYLAKEGVEFVDIRFCDLPGVMQHFAIPIGTFDDDALRDGLMFDGSSIRGFTEIHESDMKLIPDLGTAYIDPFRARKTLVMNFFVVDPFTGEPYSRDPRTIARRAEDYLRASGIADTVYFGAEPEFYVFDDVRFDDSPNKAGYHLDARGAWWNTGTEERPNLGYKTRIKGGYFPVSPNDQEADLRDEMTRLCQEVGLRIEREHHECGTGQQEINYRFDTLLAAADDLMKFKYVIKNAAFAAGKTATFMPKPLFGDAGSGMHCHQSLWKDGVPLFHDERGYGGLSDLARWYIGGLLAHAPSLLAFTNPSINSFHRLVPGFEAPVNLVYSARNRSACTRIPVTGTSAKAKRIEYRTPDGSSNPYLAFAAQLMAGLDGIRNRIEPPAPIDKDLYELPPEEHAEIEQLPQSLQDALRALEEDHDYLTEGGVFDEDIIDTWIRYKREKEIEPLRQRPHPYEFALYYDF
ncbi:MULTISPECIES: type I glutamate--ammonia ligase [Trueperella]|uniref:Glutamine synthetase n=1 Tax=Trueperella bernardiae TaxID=59561 RepID=A0A0W1KLH4_9ACTO|nr:MULTISPECIES: type I glutamate--ammonia ligase [Trueperella]KTF04881.1 Glutamine synthetase 1 [Trueperella bernardiae]MDK8602288.1 type I glutamate--ammonia ligase [Trueperella bernardiae]OCW61032.1 glutamine synthetase [Trueperella bernardiae]OFS68362.1 type I glutamate--ammonia ligase [Trueperella sp. HMSC08H06]WIM08659.1 type I glutamate--ammonia ligase [Trueperella bernardiae]